MNASRPQQEWTTPQSVLLIDSSPRGKKGYTRLYADQIESALVELEVRVKHIHLADYDIRQCLGCLQCWLKHEGSCILKDDVSELYNLYDEADLVIYTFPLYAYGVPGLLKDFIDRGVMRQYPYFQKGLSEIRHPRRDKKNKAFVVFSICGFSSFSQYDAVRSFFRLYSHSSHAPLVAEIYRPGGIFLLQNPFQYLKLKRFLKALRNAMREIVISGKISWRTRLALNVRIDEGDFLKSTNKYWDNLHRAGDPKY